jgi:hypothetical protein
MLSIFSRFLGKKKPAEQASASLLGGERYEAVPHDVSPSPTFPDAAQQPQSPPRQKNKSKDVPINPRRKQGISEAEATVEDAPTLSLNLPDPRLEEKKNQGLGIVFQGVSDGSPLLNDAILGDKRLTPAETSYLVQKTAEVIYDHGK